MKDTLVFCIYKKCGCKYEVHINVKCNLACIFQLFINLQSVDTYASTISNILRTFILRMHSLSLI